MMHIDRFTTAEVELMIQSGMRRGDLAGYFAVSVPTLRRYLKLIGVEGKQRGGRKPFILTAPKGDAHAYRRAEP